MAVANGGADLHTHTTASDGLHSPVDVVRMAREAGLEAVAITDHDTTAGVAEAEAAGAERGIAVIPGVEVSTSVDGRDIHILGYYTRNDDELWQSRLRKLRNARNERNELIVEKLTTLGVGITMEDVMAAVLARGGKEKQVGRGGSIGRPHIAEALIAVGAVSSMEEAFSRYLASGAAAYVSVPRIHPSEALQWISEAGGVSVIAHPGLYGADALVEQLAVQGADGIEVYHSDHGPEEEARYAVIARRHGLIATGGSDFHGKREGHSYHGEIGCRRVDADVAGQLLASSRRG